MKLVAPPYNGDYRGGAPYTEARAIKELLARTFSLAFFFAVSALPAFARDARKTDIRNTTWSVEQISGVTPTLLATITFGPEYHLSGTTGCNNFYGVYGVDGKEISIRTISVADGPCDAGAAQQARLLSVLRDDPSLSIEAYGKLLIDGKTGGAVTLARSR